MATVSFATGLIHAPSGAALGSTDHDTAVFSDAAVTIAGTAEALYLALRNADEHRIRSSVADCATFIELRTIAVCRAVFGTYTVSIGTRDTVSNTAVSVFIAWPEGDRGHVG